MKITKVICFLWLAVAVSSCSSDSGGSSSSTSTSVTFDGTSQTIANTQALKSENTMTISVVTSDDSYLDIEFNKFGDLKEVSYEPHDAFETYTSYQYYKSNYFTFNLVSVNESTHKVKVTFSGKLYADKNDLTSAFKTVSGTIDASYMDVTPTVAGLDLSCKIAGNDWNATEFWDNGISEVDRKFISDDQNQIIMAFSEENIAVGTYTFTTASDRRIQLAKYDTATQQYKIYNATAGNLAITSNNMVGFFRIVQGTFSFTATNPTNPADVIQVTNGSFKTNF